ncbi:MAG: hypothetical protein A3A80_04270 [Candidatus Terrybacteria bacterium RIFCSPLOWO2_01_FULL_44_24]|uniref:Type II methyltransferase M.TaqI-like domain-containing protein n=1 Tax=Candidatus Terrybacteria bacterium RIFCSPHIGHO2_01_FULL_43_35 TaxID=1802361 RepID=A0A1G2PDR1_9BACT|nr:MAG: hypothetical protein A2828_01145 [Candidatus Terrybacteria bacterium RIFCSPHIGHO2_01_FULL_43_35]OHA51850.1 MAG: hypothetical protein A3A80_04270 [Candidatus Terrybacteria bacterium RIFCSPLOWO2_01_FULL_44_24]
MTTVNFKVLALNHKTNEREMNKKQLGQFFTINSDYILNGLDKYVRNKTVVDPFAGSGDLLMWAEKQGARKVRGYDVDKKLVDNKNIFLNDSIRTPQAYKFVLTNPPYLNINKANKSIKERYFYKFSFEDLYQISLVSILNSDEGIVIVPINFLSAENSKKIRDIFFGKFRIVEMNYFKQQVFPDTTYNVIAFYYRKKTAIHNSSFAIKTSIYPDRKSVSIQLDKQYHWTIGGKIRTLINGQQNVLGIRRLVESDIKSGPIKIKAAYNHVKDVREFRISKDVHGIINSNLILLKAIDSGTPNGKIALENIREYGVECLISKPSSRHMIQLIFDTPIPVRQQKQIIDKFNKEINKLRDNHLSLFMTNYRDNDRKRISFDFVYKFINYIYVNKINSIGQEALI